MSDDNKDGSSPNFLKSESVGSADQAYILLQSSTPGEPPRKVTLEQMVDTSKLMTNMALAHEIAVDSDFQIQISPRKSSIAGIAQQVDEVMKKALWDALREKLNASPPDYSHAIVLLGDVKEYLVGCLMPGTSTVRTRIEETLDIEFIKQKVANGAFEMSDYSTFLIETMKQLCAPFRDEEVAALSNIDDPVDLFKAIFKTLENMHLDMANFTISQIRPLIRQQSVNYEKLKFDQYLKQQEEMGIDGLQYTKYWLKRSDKSQNKKENFGTNLKDLEWTPATMLAGAYLELLQWTDEEFPETCFMDEQRFTNCGYKVRQVSLISSIAYLVASYLKLSLPELEASKGSLIEDIFVLIENVPEKDYPEKLKNIAEHISLKLANSNHGSRPTLGDPIDRPGSASPPPKMLARSHSPDLSAYTELKDTIIGLWPSHLVYTSLHKRVLTYFFETLQVNKVDPKNAPKGFTSLAAGQMNLLCEQYFRLVSHNRAVYGRWYSAIMKPYFPGASEQLSTNQQSSPSESPAPASSSGSPGSSPGPSA